eukprot:scaffold9412_cov45-Phaeocystis_antarctica.AAC.1
MQSTWIFPRDNNGFSALRALIGSRLKFWTVPQRELAWGSTDLGRPLESWAALRGSLDRRRVDLGSWRALINRSLAKPEQGLVIQDPESRIRDPGRVGC